MIRIARLTMALTVLTLAASCHPSVRRVPIGMQGPLGGIAVNHAKNIVYVTNSAQSSITLLRGSGRKET